MTNVLDRAPDSYHPLYTTWYNTRERCYNPCFPGYHRYGGRGIKMSVEWMRSFKTFADDMGDKPTWSDVLVIIDESKGFQKGNCEWVPRSCAAHRRTLTKTSASGVRGVHWNSASGRWQATIGSFGKAINLGYYKNLEDAVAARKRGEEAFHAPLINFLKPKNTTTSPASPTSHLSDVDLLS